MTQRTKSGVWVRSLCLLGLLGGTGCGGAAAPKPVTPVRPSARPAAKVHQERVGPFAIVVAELRPARTRAVAPDAAYVGAACEGDAAALDRLPEAFRLVAATRPALPTPLQDVQWQQTALDRLGIGAFGCTNAIEDHNRAFCAAMASMVRDGDGVRGPALTTLIARAVENCATRELDPFFASPEMPAELWARWASFQELGSEPLAWRPEWERHFAAALASGNELDIGNAASALLEIDAQRAKPFVLQAVAAARSEQSRAGLLRALLDREPAPDAECVPTSRSWPDCAIELKVAPGASVGVRCERAVFDVARGARARDAVVAGASERAHAALAGPQYEYEWTDCLRAVADLDWDRARALVQQNAARLTELGWPADPDMFAAGRDPRRMHARLIELGVLPAGTPWPAQGSVRSAFDLLEAAGRAAHVDPEAVSFPNRHDRLLAQLARLASPELDGVSFWEHAPSEAEAYGEPRTWQSGQLVVTVPNPTAATYVLGAQLDGTQLELDARSLGDWYDLEAAAGMVNALLARRGAAVRLLSIERDPSGPFYVVAAPAALRRALEAGLFDPPPEPQYDEDRPGPVDIVEDAARARGLRFPEQSKPRSIPSHAAVRAFDAEAAAGPKVLIRPRQELTLQRREDGVAYFEAPDAACAGGCCFTAEAAFDGATRALTPEQQLERLRAQEAKR